MSAADESEGIRELDVCPSWCRTPPSEHAQDDPGGWLHEGPSFGLLRTWLLDGAEPVFTATMSETVGGADELTPDDLRQLATDALDAAMWMDRQANFGDLGRDTSVVDMVRRAHGQSSRSA